MIKKNKCVICNTTNFRNYFSSSLSLPSDRRLVYRNSDVGYCYNCKLILNSTGCRKSKSKFYHEEYNLLGKKADDEFRIYSKSNSGTESEIMSKYFFQNTRIRKKADVLEIGAGKGLFLRHLKRLLPKLNYHALEPSKNAAKYFRKNLPSISFDNKPLEKSKFKKKKFDIIVSTGVIEHVNSPNAFMKSMSKMLKNDGIVFFCMPNFECKVDDLIVFDHLSKITKNSINFLLYANNFKIIKQNISKKRIWIWNILKKNKKKMKKKFVNNDLKILKSNINKFKKMEEDFINYYKNNKKLNFYCLGNSGFYFYFKYFNKIKKKINFIILDNSSLNGSKFFGVKIISRNQIKQYKLDNIYISANPCYHALMRKKLINSNFTGQIYS